MGQDQAGCLRDAMLCQRDILIFPPKIRKASRAPVWRIAHRALLCLLMGQMVFMLVGCTSRGSYRYRLTVQVDTPEGVRSGSSILEVRYYNVPDWLPNGGGTSSQYRGEAVAVDLPGGQTLFALLTGQDGGSIERFAPEAIRAAGQPVTAESIQNVRGIFRVPLEYYPQFVRFRHLAKPNSVEAVDPSNLSRSFGQNTRLKSVLVQITEEKPSFSITKRLPWLKDFRTSLDGQRYQMTHDLANNLYRHSFIRGDQE